MELEIFVHGALCMAYSGRCLLSGYINKRDPNQGTCTNACRWEYNVQEGKEDSIGNIVHIHEPIPVQNVEPTLGIGAPTDKVFMIEEAQRPGEYMTAFEDEHGTYIMNSKDLRAIQHVERLTKMGVHSLKIEGRTKSFYYCARTAQVYRRAIDDAAAVLELTADYDWLATKDIKSPEDLVGYDAIWVVPGSPYENEDGAFIAIRYARENAIPFLGTCGGFQHAVIEYARNVLGWSDANHGETVQSGRLVITPLSCSLVEQTGEVELRPHTLIARAYGRDEIVEAYHCNFGVASAFVEALNADALKVTGWDNDGDVRAIELTTHPFFVATLFQHERGALEGRPVPLAREFLRAARR